MMKPDQWRPIDVASLEDAALAAVKAGSSTLVAASPGTGKTELLGQRAAYLLQTGLCPFPRRILAISFKRDAAANLRGRVEQRCGVEVAHQLDSMTFDAFAKQVLDRFWRALPERWKLTGNYQIGAAFPERSGFNEYQLSVANDLANPFTPAGWAAALRSPSPTAFDINAMTYDQYNHGIQRLCLEPLTVPDAQAFLQLVTLRRALAASPPKLSFAQITCLATAIISSNPAIREAIRATYSHVFLDEFQDTTSIQYGLLKAIFLGSSCVLTAVGDAKQRIMGWAGAQRDVFAAFEADFLAHSTGPSRLTLARNYRSNERIVAILNVLKNKIAPTEPDFVALRTAPPRPDSEIFALLIANDQDAEARGVASIIMDEIAAGTAPRSIGLLIRQRASDWEERLKPAFDAAGVQYRNEDRNLGGATIQDLMTEIYSRIILDLVEFLTRKHGGALWSTAMGHFAAAKGIELQDNESSERQLAELVDAFHKSNQLDSSIRPDATMVKRVVTAIENALGLEHLRRLAPQYETGIFFDSIRKACLEFFTECAENTASWNLAIDRYRGIGQVPLLTITKSKGLEYDLVVLLGLNDNEWWSFALDTEEGHSLFFVAASRARERLVLTRCSGDRVRKIDEIFELLEKAGVSAISA